MLQFILLGLKDLVKLLEAGEDGGDGGRIRPRRRSGVVV